MNNEYGKILDYKIENNKVVIQFEKREAFVEIIDDYIINFYVPFHRKERNSKAIENLKVNSCHINVKKVNNYIKIDTDKLIIKINDEFMTDIYDKNGTCLCADYRKEAEGFQRRHGDYVLAEAEGHAINSVSDLKVKIVKEMPSKETYFYGCGEKTGHLNKRGYHYVNWNTDNPQPHGETFDRLYQSNPFFIGLNEDNAFGIFFDNHFESVIDLGRDNSEFYYFGAVDGNLDYYFIYGPDVKDVVKGYTYLTGNIPMMQKWTLGYSQCRWSYENEERVMEIAENFRKRDIPCDTIYLDIDYMDGYRVFTWNNERFKAPSHMINRLKKMGFKIVTIIDPGVKVDKSYKVYKEGLKNNYFAKDKNGLVYVNEVWPGDAVYPDFLNSRVRKWWGTNVKSMMDVGVDGIWNDMNEPASFNGPLPDDILFDNDGIEVEHKEAHNIYGHFMAKATYEGIKEATNKRPFVITRAAYAGTQKYSTSWTGDNQSTWEHLRMSLPMLMNMGLSGSAFCGTDVGGFGFDCTGELLSRWVQVGAFTPLFRNHSTMGTRDQEPWAFDEKTEEINRKFIKLRYKLIPYLYDMMYKCSKDGSPIIRPLLYNYQNDKNTYEINDEFLCGDNILVAPVVEQGISKRIVYLPEGDSWVDYDTKEIFDGGQYIIKDAPIDICPIFIKGNSILPIGIDNKYIGENKEDRTVFEIFAGKSGESSYIHYNDDGETFEYNKGEYDLYEINVRNDDEIIVNVKAVNNKFNLNNDFKFIAFNSSKNIIINR